MIVDTNALSGFADGDPGVAAMIDRSEVIAIPVIVLGEYRQGIVQSRHKESYEAWLSKYLPAFKVLDVVEATASYYSTIVIDLKKIGKPIPTNDVWIAALCQQHSMPLLSRDRHFDLVRGIKRIEW